jgi:hypothetical protein
VDEEKKKKKDEKEKGTTRKTIKKKNYDNFRVFTVQEFLVLPALQTLRRHIEE